MVVELSFCGGNPKESGLDGGVDSLGYCSSLSRGCLAR